MLLLLLALLLAACGSDAVDADTAAVREPTAPGGLREGGDIRTDSPFEDRAEPWAAGPDGSLPADFVLPNARLHESLGTTYGDFDYLDMLHDACERENMEACDHLRSVAPLDSRYRSFGRACGGHREQEGSITLDCVHLRTSEEIAAEAAVTISDEADADAWWTQAEVSSPELIDQLCQAFEDRTWDATLRAGEAAYEDFNVDPNYRRAFIGFAVDRCGFDPDA